MFVPIAAAADPIKLKLSFFSSDRSNIYQNSIKPFVEAVNNDSRGLIEIEVYFSGSITRVQADQPRLLADGTADLALIVPGRTPEQFTDTAVMALPGIYRDQRQASLVFTRLLEAGALTGYGDYFVVGAFVAGGESIHTAKPVVTNKDLHGLTIRVNNPTQAAVVRALGAVPVLLAINQTTDAFTGKAIDGATFPPSIVFEFGIGRVATSHYMVDLGGAPNVLVMNRKRFDSLPANVQAIIRKYSGEWLAQRSATSFETLDRNYLRQMQSDPRRTVTFPSGPDIENIRRIEASVVDQWAAQSPHNRKLLDLVRAEIVKLQASERAAQ